MWLGINALEFYVKFNNFKGSPQDYNANKGKIISYLRFKTLKIHNLLTGGTYLSGRHIGVAPPPPSPPQPPRNKDNMCEFSDVFKLFVVNLIKHKQHLTKLGKKSWVVHCHSFDKSITVTGPKTLTCTVI